MSVTPLTLAECPLLTQPGDGRLVDEFNERLERAHKLSLDFPDLDLGLEERLEELAALRSQLTQKLYRVGFLSTTGAGKSTTFNNVLSASEKDQPALPGAGSATTSAVSRLRRSDSGTNTLKLRYLSTDQFHAKRNTLIKAVNLEHLGPQTPDSEFFAKLENERVKLREGKTPAVVDDIDNFELFLNSARAYRAAKVHDKNLEEEPPYEQRGEFLNHARRGGGTLPPVSPAPLLREAEIKFNTTVIPEHLEMIDLPGLGKGGDTELTLDFLQQLDGVLIFLRCDQLSDRNVEEILRNLKQGYEGHWHDRVWVVATKFDTLTINHFELPPTNNWFDNIKEFLSKHQLASDHLLIVRNLAFSAAFTNYLRQPVEDWIRSYPDLAEPLRAVMNDADRGIALLRHLISKELAVEVGKQIRLASGRKLDSLDRDLSTAQTFARRQRTQSREDLFKAVACRDKINFLLRKLSGRPANLRKMALDIREELHKIFETLLSAEHVNHFRRCDELVSALEPTMRNLDRYRDAILLDKVLEPLYREIEDDLRELPEVHLVDAPSVQKKWQDVGRPDPDDKTWLQRVPRFYDNTVLEHLKRSGKEDFARLGREYRAIVQVKMDLVIDQTIHMARVRFQRELEAIRRDLNKLICEDSLRTNSPTTVVGGA